MKQSDTSEPPSTSNRVGVVILAAGQGTRMRSRLPKVAHPIAGRPMIRQVVEVGRALEPAVVAVVVGHAAEKVVQAAGVGVTIVHQTEQLGTGHAVLQAREALRGHCDLIAVLYGDTVLVTPATLERMIDRASGATLVILTASMDEQTQGFGRIQRDPDGRVIAILELRGDSPTYDQIREVNSGVMVFHAEWLWEEVGRLPRRVNGEFFLTDLVSAAIEQERVVETVDPGEPAEMWGVNTQAQLAEANRITLDRIRRRCLDVGVRMTDPATVYVDSDVVLEPDVVIQPNTYLYGVTRVAAGSEIGPNSIVRDSIIGGECRVVASMLEESWVGDGVTIGPFAHLRPGSRIEDGAELGNYAEVKGSTIGAGSRMHHFGYVGDATVGPNVNIGAGTVTCNFDGETKHRTDVGAGAFIGSDTMLVAPVTIGEGARTGAGSVVTRDVEAGRLVVGMPARPVPRRERTADDPEMTSQPKAGP